MEIKDDYVKVIGGLKEEAKTIEKQLSEGRLAQMTYDERKEANRTAEVYIREEHVKSINEVISDFKEFTDYVRVPRGERLTSDNALFNGSLTIDEGDLREIADRNKYNLTMVNVIITYAKKMDILLTESMINNFSQLTKDYDNILNMIKSYISDESGNAYGSRYVEKGLLDETLEEDAAYYADLDNYAKAAGITAE